MNMRDKLVTTFQRRVANPVMRRNPRMTLLETTGRVSGEPRQTPVGGRRIGDQFWLVSEFGERSQYVRNIRANPRVRLRLNGRWHSGLAVPMPDDDAHARLQSLPRGNSMAVAAFGSSLMTVRIELDR